MDIHEQYNAMMADVERVKQMRADLDTSGKFTAHGCGEKVLDFSQEKYKVMMLHYLTRSRPKWE